MHNTITKNKTQTHRHILVYFAKESVFAFQKLLFFLCFPSLVFCAKLMNLICMQRAAAIGRIVRPLCKYKTLTDDQFTSWWFLFVSFFIYSFWAKVNRMSRETGEF